MPLLDTHAHVYLPPFDADADAVRERARAAGVEAVLLPAIDAASVRRALALAEQHPGFYFAMAALHPTEVGPDWEEKFREIEALAGEPGVVAVGESGLDYYWSREHEAHQRAALAAHARLAIEKDLPLVLHDRDQKGSPDSSRDLVDVLAEVKRNHPDGERLRGVFHCFGGPADHARRVLDLGFHVGLGGTLTFKNGGVPEAVADVPLQKIVLETDAPYLAPAPHRGTRNEPAYVRLVAEKLAAVRGIGVGEVEAVTTANARALFGLEAR